ncbi:MAG: ankyrin repeat domain-containing protein [Myxococcales bacterium]|nr:ankyrin repeat domain-containing protein [Myxococcales bacterium]
MSDELLKAIIHHDLDEMAQALARGADPNVIFTELNGWRPLHAAVDALEHGASIASLVLLLRCGADVEAWDAAHTVNPLLMALFRDRHEAVRLFLAAGANPNVVGDEGDVPLRWSVERGDRETAKLLLYCGADQAIDLARGFRGMNALGCAVRTLDLPMIELLLSFGADPNRLDTRRRTAHDHLPDPQTVAPAKWSLAKALLDRARKK